MSLDPLLQASPAIQIHAVAAMAAFVLGLSQFALIKGTTRHRIAGWAWVALMVVVSVTAFFIHELRLWGPWSPIHLLAIFTLAMLPRRCCMRGAIASPTTSGPWSASSSAP